MNLPASVMSFLPFLIGLYAGHETLFFPYTGIQLPLIHLYCFVHPQNHKVRTHIRGEIAAYMSCDVLDEEQVTTKFVRKVAPGKSMYYASFRLPAEVAFRQMIEGLVRK